MTMLMMIFCYYFNDDDDEDDGDADHRWRFGFPIAAFTNQNMIEGCGRIHWNYDTTN